MGFNLRKSKSIGKNTRINFSKSGIGISTGVKGYRVSVGPKGIRRTASIPGTGLYSSTTTSWNSGAPSADIDEVPLPDGVQVPPYPPIIAVCTLLGALSIFIAFFFLPALAVGLLLLIIAVIKMLTDKSYKCALCVQKAIKAYKKGNFAKCVKLCTKSLRYKDNEPAKILTHAIEQIISES